MNENPYKIPRGETRRYDCPYCQGKNTFVVTNDRGNLLFFCFRDSCHARGARRITRTIEDMKEELKEATEDKNEEFVLPEHFKHPHNNTKVMEWLKYHNCSKAYNRGAADIRYDPKANRIVFVSYHPEITSKKTGATGRALTSNQMPKWYEYGKSKMPFICALNTGCRKGVLVEDAASACAVAATEKYAGIALRGTHLPDEYIPFLIKGYGELVIALDRDASKTAIDLHRKISGSIANTRTVLLRADLKYFSPDTILRAIER